MPASLIRPEASNFGISSGEPAGEGDAVEADEEDENREPRKMNRPHAPTKAELDEHLPLHLTYREWCPHCVAGKGISTRHMSSGGEKTEVTWNMDYCFLGNKADTSLVEVEADDADEEGTIAMLVT